MGLRWFSAFSPPLAMPRGAFALMMGAAVLLGTAQAARAEVSPEDPLQSVMWSTVRDALFAGERMVFDAGVVVTTAAKVENNMQVPVLVEVAPSLGPIREIVVFADHNPIPKILRYRPLTAEPRLGFALKVQEATPIRAAAQTADGVWHVGGMWADAAGGGCTTPSLGQKSRLWESHLNEVSARRWPRDGGQERLAVSLVHPMDTGLADGIPAFYLRHLVIKDANGQALAELFPAEPVAENPVFSLDLHPAQPGAQPWRIEGVDSDGNPVSAVIPPSPPVQEAGQ